MVSSFEPLLIAATKPSLSQWNATLLRQSSGPQTAQLNTIGTNSFAIMLIVDHSSDHGCCSQRLAKTASKPHEPDASVYTWYSKVRFAE